MFSGIVETIGYVRKFEITADLIHMSISPEIQFDDLSLGDSVSVNGVCLTVTRFNENTFDVTVVPETMRLSNLSHLSLDSIINLERSIKMTTRIGGHFMQGHVDGMGEIIELKKEGKEALIAKIAVPSSLSKYIVNKGYVSLDGMSITVIEAAMDWFTVTFIPHTQAVTIVNQYKVGSLINIEVDIMGKYIEKLMGEKIHAAVS